MSPSALRNVTSGLFSTISTVIGKYCSALLSQTLFSFFKLMYGAYLSASCCSREVDAASWPLAEAVNPIASANATTLANSSLISPAQLWGCIRGSRFITSDHEHRWCKSLVFYH